LKAQSGCPVRTVGLACDPGQSPQPLMMVLINVTGFILAQQCGLREMDHHPFCRGLDQQNRIVD
jgi:hypothetical protein